MSENVQITPGSGVTIGADGVIDGTLGPAQIQYIKIMDGTIGGTNKAAVTSNGLAVDGSAVTQPISGTITVQQPTPADLLTTAYLNDGSGNPITSTSGSLNVEVTNTVPVSGVDNSASGTFTAPGQTLSISTVGCSTVQYATTGASWVGTIITEVSYDNGTTWYPQATNDTDPTVNLQFPTWGNSASNFFNDDPWVVNVAGTTNFRLRVVTFTSGSLSLEIISTAAVPSISVPDNDRWNAGSLESLNAIQEGSTAGCSSCGIQITGTFVGTITFQASMDTHSFFPVPAINVSTNEISTTTTTTGNFIVTCGGYNLVQVVMSSYVSGSAVIIFNSGSGSNIGSFQDTGLVTTSAPTYVNGQVGALSLTTAGALRVDGSAVTQPISGSVSVSGTVNANVTNASIPVTQSGSWTVSLTSESIEIGKVDQGTPNTLANAWPVSLSDGTNLLGTSSHPVRIDPTGTTTQPVSLASTTITGTVAVTQSTSPWVVSGTITANAGTGTFTVGQAIGTNLHTVVDSGSITVANSTLAVTQSTSPWVVSLTSTTITGTVTVAGNLTHDNAAPAANNVGVLPAVASSAAPTYNAGDQVLLSTDLSGNLRVTIDSTSSEQNVNLNQVGGSAISIGQATMAASLPVVIASNQSSIPVTLTSTTITGTVAVTQSTSPWVDNITQWDSVALGSPSAYGTSPGAVNVIGVNAFITNTPTVTANAGTNLNTSALALDTSVNGILVSQGSTTSGEKGPLIQGAVTTSSPSYTTAQTSPLSLTLAGALRVDASATTQPISGTVTANAGTGNFTVVQSTAANLNATVSGTVTSNQGTAAALSGAWSVEVTDGTNILGTSSHPLRIDPTGTTTQPVSGTVTANQGGAPWSQNITQIGGNTVITGGANGLLAVAGPVASGSANADNPLKIGAVFNTTQPTVTNGEIVDAQATARGALIVATGVDTFNVTVNTALPAGSNTIGAVTQASGPWTVNLTQVAGSSVATAATGIAKVGLTDGSGNAITSTSGALNENMSSVGGVSVAATAKGTQATNFVPMQQPKDSGRNYLTFTADAIAGVLAETLVTFTTNKQGTTTASQTNYTPTSGKTLRIQTITLSVQSGAGAGAWTRIFLRHNTAGATTTSSALVYVAEHGTINATAISQGLSIPIPDGLEIYGDGTQTIGISHISSATTAVESITVSGYEY